MPKLDRAAQLARTICKPRRVAWINGRGRLTVYQKSRHSGAFGLMRAVRVPTDILAAGRKLSTADC